MMRIQFTIRQGMLAIATVALCLSISLGFYRAVIVPRSPLVWSRCTVDDIRKENVGRCLIIVADDLSENVGFPFIRADLDRSAIRSLVAAKEIKCWHCLPSEALELYLESRGLTSPDIFPYMITMNGGHVIAYPLNGDDVEQLVVRQIKDDFLSGPSIPK